MALLGNAALAMWWDMSPEMKSDFEDWHTHEHFPERLGIPGFLRATRWTSLDDDGVFVLYELKGHSVLSSPEYLARLNAPTPWSSRLMPQHRNMVRSQNHVVTSFGGVASRFLLTFRLALEKGHEESFIAAINTRASANWQLPGIFGIHLLKHEAPDIPKTAEQIIRGADDQVSAWTLIIAGYEKGALDAMTKSNFSTETLRKSGATEVLRCGTYSLSASSVLQA